MPKAHQFHERPWWDTGAYPLHREDGSRIRHRVNYQRIPIHPEFTACGGLHDLHHWDPAKRLKARKKLWRRLRSGYYDRHDPQPSSWARPKTGQPAPRCNARCRDGHPCRARAILNPVTRKRVRCRMHGGLSSGPKSEAGRNASLAALARGRANRRRKSA